MCNARGGGRGFLCPQGTKFNQKTMVCDFAARVKCDQSSNFFHRNVIIHEASLAATKPSNINNTYSPFSCMYRVFHLKIV